MKSRLERLLVPFLIWPLFIWCFNNLLYLILKKNRFGRIISFRELFIQLITGRMFLIQLWFLFNLIFLSIFFYILSFLHWYMFFLILYFFSVICYAIQHYENNYILYLKFKDCIAHSVGHIIISFPIAVTAFTFNKINLIIYLQNLRYKFIYWIIFIITIILFFIGKANTYIGFDKNLYSLFIFYVIHLIPLNKYLNNNFKSIIYMLTSFTNGIYVLHIVIKFYLFRIFKFPINFISCIFLYMICYSFSFLGKIIFEKNILKYLFI